MSTVAEAAAEPDHDAPIVAGMAAAEDWAGLLRWWLARDYSPAREQALAILHRFIGDRDGSWAELAVWVNNLPNVAMEPVFIDFKVLTVLTSAEQITIQILAHFPVGVLCNEADKAPAPEQPALFARGIEACRRILELARSIGDEPLQAAHTSRLATGCSGVGDHIGALAALADSVTARRSLTARHAELFRAGLGRLTYRLGNAQWENRELEAARSSYEESLAVRRELAKTSPEVHRPDVARTLSNLGRVQRMLDQLEGARMSHEAALEIWRGLTKSEPEVHRANLARILGNLGAVQLDLNQLEAARASFEEALAIHRELAMTSPEVYRVDVALALNDLGRVQIPLTELKAARANYEEALAIQRELTEERPDLYRPYVAMTLTNLGVVHGNLNESEAAETTFAEAVEIYRELAERRPEVYRLFLAAILNNQGYLRFNRLDLESARASFKEATRIYTDLAMERGDFRVIARRRSHENLALLLRQEDSGLGLPDYREAYDNLGVACRLTNRFRAKFRDERQRHRVMAEAVELFELHVRNCVDLWETTCVGGQPDFSVLAEALWAAESSRSRQLLDRLSAAELKPARLTPEIVEALRALDTQIAQARGKLETSWKVGDTSIDGSPEKGAKLALGDARKARARREEVAVHEIETLEQKKAALIERLRQNDPEVTPEPTVPALSFEAIRESIPTDKATAFVEYFIGREASFAFLALADGRMFSVKLPALHGDAVQELALMWFAGYSTAREELASSAGSSDPHVRQLGFGEFVRAWQAIQAEVLPLVSNAVLVPVLQEIKENGLSIKRLVVAPHQVLHVFPLHACPLPDGGRLGDPDKYEISYTPSFSLLHRCAERRREGPGRVLLIDDPTSDDPQRRLSFTAAEAMALRVRLSCTMAVTTLRGDEATPHAFRAGAESARVLHYSGHAGFNGGDPLQSQLVLHGAPLTLADVFSKTILRNNALTVLNGCESGLLLPDVIDDYHNFTTGFLFAGAPCVITTLWTVPDLTSALIMDEFYRQWETGEAPAAALQAAQESVRTLRRGAALDAAVKKLTEALEQEDEIKAARCREQARAYAAEFGEYPFAEPVHWAAFTCNGLGFRRLE